MQFDTRTFTDLLFSTTFLEAAWITLWVTVVAMALGIALGGVGAVGRMSSIGPLRLLVAAYLWVFRGTPLIVQIIFWYDATAELTDKRINLPPLFAGVVALGVQQGAYMTEVIRSGLQSVDVGQREAAAAVGMTRPQIFRHVVLPQAIRVILPPTANQAIDMLKSTSLLFTIAVPELFATATTLYSTNFRYFEVLTVVSLWYLLLTSLLTELQRRLERRYGPRELDLGDRPPGMAARLLGSGVARWVTR